MPGPNGMSVIVEIDWGFGIDFLEPATKMRAIEERKN
jgi:hypothetical protein